MQRGFQQMHSTLVGCCWYEKKKKKKGFANKKIKIIPHSSNCASFLGVQCKNMSWMTAHISSSLLYSDSFLWTTYCLLHVNGLLTMYGVMRPWVRGQLWYMMVKIGLCCTDDLISIFWGLGRKMTLFTFKCFVLAPGLLYLHLIPVH